MYVHNEYIYIYIRIHMFIYVYIRTCIYMHTLSSHSPKLRQSPRIAQLRGRVAGSAREWTSSGEAFAGGRGRRPESALCCAGEAKSSEKRCMDIGNKIRLYVWVRGMDRQRYVYTYISIDIRIHICSYTYVNKYISLCIYIYIYIQTRLHT